VINFADEAVNKMGDDNGDNIVNKVEKTLKNSDGLTITEIVKKTKLNRSAIRTALAKLDGAEKVIVRKIGMAKIYSLNKRRRK
jgi:DNA-binding transcriptional ArsR family regulator